MVRKAVKGIRLGILMVLTLAAVGTGAAWAANWPFPLGVLQTVGLADQGNVRGVKWEVTLPRGLAVNNLWVRARETSVHLSWDHLRSEAYGKSTRWFWGNPWPAGIKRGGFAGAINLRLADGSSVDYWGYWQLFLEIPLLGLCVVLGTYPTVVLIRGPLRRWRRRKKGLCLKCAYDLTGNVSGVCPECGSEVESP